MEEDDFSIKKKNITSDDILGKNLLDSEGKLIGVTMALNIDSKTKNILGLTIDRGFMKPNIFVGIDLIKIFGVDSIILNTTLPIKYFNMPVYDINGKFIGKIKIAKFDSKTKEPIMIKVKSGILSSIIIPKKNIKRIDKGAILRKTKQEILLEWKENKKELIEEFMELPLL